MADNGLPLRILEVPPAERDVALRLVFRQLGDADRRQQVDVLRRAGGSRPDWEGLQGAYRGRRLVGAVLFQVQPGRFAALWAPQVIVGEPATTARQLLDAAIGQLAGRHVDLVQTLVERDAQAEAAVLREGGFEHLADLLYLACPEDEFPHAPPQTPLGFEPYSPADPDRLVRIVDATYVGTRDCPGLNGIRGAADVLAGYQATGVFDPGRWLIVRHEGADVGCLILTDYAEHDTLELVYMGIVPAARGLGWGMDTARHAQWLTHRAGRGRLVLAVDAVNEPALRTYAAVGFRAWDRRSAYVKLFRRV